MVGQGCKYRRRSFFVHPCPRQVSHLLDAKCPPKFDEIKKTRMGIEPLFLFSFCFLFIGSSSHNQTPLPVHPLLPPPPHPHSTPLSAHSLIQPNHARGHFHSRRTGRHAQSTCSSCKECGTFLCFATNPLPQVAPILFLLFSSIGRYPNRKRLLGAILH